MGTCQSRTLTRKSLNGPSKTLKLRAERAKLLVDVPDPQLSPIGPDAKRLEPSVAKQPSQIRSVEIPDVLWRSYRWPIAAEDRRWQRAAIGSLDDEKAAGFQRFGCEPAQCIGLTQMLDHSNRGYDIEIPARRLISLQRSDRNSSRMLCPRDLDCSSLVIESPCLPSRVGGNVKQTTVEAADVEEPPARPRGELIEDAAKGGQTLESLCGFVVARLETRPIMLSELLISRDRVETNQPACLAAYEVPTQTMIEVPPILGMTCDALHNRGWFPLLHGATLPESVKAFVIRVTPAT